jgi:hypothetical protein
MQKITKEEADKMLFSSHGKSYLRLTLEQMKKGEILHIQPADCRNKRGPFEAVSRSSTSTRKYKVRTLHGRKGWLVERVV